jgi:uncharacterized membrane protein
VTGFVLSIVLRSFAYSFGFPWVYVLFNIISIITIVGLLDKMPFWSLSYLLGWLIGLVSAGRLFMSPLEFLLYLGITLLVLYKKLSD